MLNKLKAVVDNIPMMVAFKDTNNNVVAVNKNAADFMGMRVEEFSNIHIKHIFPNDYERFYKYDQEIIKNKKQKIKFIEKFKDSFIEVSVIPLLNDEEEVENLMLFMSDITKEYKLEKENKRNEKLLYHQNKLAAMGEVLENIAHQWRQPLTTISTASTGVKIKKELDMLSDEELLSSMNAINDTAQYLSQTIDDFRTFINPKKNDLEWFRIEDVIEKTLKFTTTKRLMTKIEIVKNIENIEILSLQSQLIQVLINILNNAIDVLSLKDGEKYIFIDVFSSDDRLYINIKDNAGGIKIDIIKKVFEPYFTTKHQSQGTGIGLYMSRKIVYEQLSGTIKVENKKYSYNDKKYKGACFKIELPFK